MNLQKDQKWLSPDIVFWSSSRSSLKSKALGVEADRCWGLNCRDLLRSESRALERLKGSEEAEMVVS